MTARTSTLPGRWRLVALAVLLTSLLAPAVGRAGAAGPPALTTLQPGGFRTIHQDLRVNVVFVGYRPGAGPRDIDEAAFRAQLPRGYNTINRIPSYYSLFYGGRTSDAGVTFDYRYDVRYADAAFDDAFFGYLASIAVADPNPSQRTFYQDLYNAQQARALDVGQSHWIDAPSVERWLAANAGARLGVDTAQYTVFLVNWYGRPDFRFHVYTKIGEPDPDTGYDFGLIRHSRKLIAWGGTPPDDAETGLGALHRIWFYDLSAGPEYNTANYDVDDADLDGDGVLDYRMPPVWEYGSGKATYRPFTDLSGDLGKVVRYVALDLLFTASPLYKPALSPPALPAALQFDLNVYQADPGVDGRRFLTPGYLLAKESKLRPDNTLTAEVKVLPFAAQAANVYGCWLANVSCYGQGALNYPFADLYLYHRNQLPQLLEGDADYEVPIFLYSLPDALAPPLSGYADLNYRDGTQTFIYVFNSPASVQLGQGFTEVVIHEVGHHLGLSHPHDGYDAAPGNDFGPTGPLYFAWSGDETNTIMNYLRVNFDFSQFDRDNMDRWLTAAYLNQANALLPRILASPRAAQAGALLTSADGQAAAALAAYDRMDYRAAARLAKGAYDDVSAAAAQLGLKVEPEAWQADYKAFGKSFKFVDPLDRLGAP
ncbi:MAG TPA: hypothetical protein VF310_04350 [Vicinamibacteria bacterium]